MKYYAVLGQEQMFYGLHGMSEMAVITANDFEEASRYAEELSYEVINSYSQITESILMENVTIGRHAEIKRAIIKKNGAPEKPAKKTVHKANRSARLVKKVEAKKSK